MHQVAFTAIPHLTVQCLTDGGIKIRIPPFSSPSPTSPPVFSLPSWLNYKILNGPPFWAHYTPKQNHFGRSPGTSRQLYDLFLPFWPRCVGLHFCWYSQSPSTTLWTDPSSQFKRWYSQTCMRGKSHCQQIFLSPPPTRHWGSAHKPIWTPSNSVPQNQVCPRNRWYLSYYALKSLPQSSHPPHPTR